MAKESMTPEEEHHIIGLVELHEIVREDLALWLVNKFPGFVDILEGQVPMKAHETPFANSFTQLLEPAERFLFGTLWKCINAEAGRPREDCVITGMKDLWVLFLLITWLAKTGRIEYPRMEEES